MILWRHRFFPNIDENFRLSVRGQIKKVVKESNQAFEFHKRNQTSNVAGLNTLQHRRYQISVKNWRILMIHSTKRDQYWSFWRQDDQTIGMLFEEIGLLRPLRSKELERSFRPGKSLLQFSRILNSIIWVLKGKGRNPLQKFCWYMYRKKL